MIAVLYIGEYYCDAHWSMRPLYVWLCEGKESWCVRDRSRHSIAVSVGDFSLSVIILLSPIVLLHWDGLCGSGPQGSGCIRERKAGMLLTVLVLALQSVCGW